MSEHADTEHGNEERMFLNSGRGQSLDLSSQNRMSLNVLGGGQSIMLGRVIKRVSKLFVPERRVFSNLVLVKSAASLELTAIIKMETRETMRGATSRFFARGITF